MSGKLIIVSAPSGAGKTTIIKHLLEQNFNLEFSISACSRKLRGKEVHGVDYYFMTPSEFRKKIDNGEFLEWEEVYPESFYGTLKSEVVRIKEKGNNVIFDVDVIGGINIKKFYGDKALSLFIMPPSIELLEERLRSRSTDTEAAITTRVNKAKAELEFAPKFDKTIVNDNLEEAFGLAEQTVRAFLNS